MLTGEYSIPKSEPFLLDIGSSIPSLAFLSEQVGFVILAQAGIQSQKQGDGIPRARSFPRRDCRICNSQFAIRNSLFEFCCP